MRIIPLRAGEACPDGYVSIPILNPSEMPPEYYRVHVQVDIPALSLRAGTSLEMEAQTRVDCDSLYHMADGSLARIHCWDPGTKRIVRESGAVEIVPSRGVLDQVQGCSTGREWPSDRGAARDTEN